MKCVLNLGLHLLSDLQFEGMVRYLAICNKGVAIRNTIMGKCPLNLRSRQSLLPLNFARNYEINGEYEILQKFSAPSACFK